jgi:hypothetical protein
LAYSSFFDAAKIREGFVVASWGWYLAMARDPSASRVAYHPKLQIYVLAKSPGGLSAHCFLTVIERGDDSPESHTTVYMMPRLVSILNTAPDDAPNRRYPLARCIADGVTLTVPVAFS